MATRVIPPRILRNLRYNTATKPLKSANAPLSPTLSPSPSLPPPQTSAVLRPAATADLNLSDVEKLFSHVRTTALLRSATVLHATAVEPFVDFGTWLMRSNLVHVPGIRELVFATVRSTFYDHFCAGEDAPAAASKIRALNHAGLRGMLVYGVEDALDNDACDRNFRGFLRTIDVSRSLPPSSVTPSSFFSSFPSPLLLLIQKHFHKNYTNQHQSIHSHDLSVYNVLPFLIHSTHDMVLSFFF